MTKRMNDIDLSAIMDDYCPDDSIWRIDDERMHKLKHILHDRLSEVERRIMIVYAENSSQKKTAEELGVSLSTINHKIKEIQNKIKNELFD